MRPRLLSPAVAGREERVKPLHVRGCADTAAVWMKTLDLRAKGPADLLGIRGRRQLEQRRDLAPSRAHRRIAIAHDCKYRRQMQELASAEWSGVAANSTKDQG